MSVAAIVSYSMQSQLIKESFSRPTPVKRPSGIDAVNASLNPLSTSDLTYSLVMAGEEDVQFSQPFQDITGVYQEMRESGFDYDQIQGFVEATKNFNETDLREFLDTANHLGEISDKSHMVDWINMTTQLLNTNEQAGRNVIKDVSAFIMMTPSAYPLEANEVKSTLSPAEEFIAFAESLRPDGSAEG
jgi:hypothetical protein